MSEFFVGSEAPVFSLRTQLSSRGILVEARGQLDMATAPELWECLMGLAPRSLPILLDLSGITFVDCAGWRPVALAGNYFRENGGGFMVVKASLEIERLVGLLAVMGYEAETPMLRLVR